MADRVVGVRRGGVGCRGLVRRRLVGRRLVGGRAVGGRAVGGRLIGGWLIGGRLIGRRAVGRRLIGWRTVGRGSTRRRVRLVGINCKEVRLVLIAANAVYVAVKDVSKVRVRVRRTQPGEPQAELVVRGGQG